MQIEIKNWEKYQPRTDRTNFSWFRFQNSFFTSQSGMMLSAEEQRLFIFILCEASKKNNSKIELFCEYVTRVLGFSQIPEKMKSLENLELINLLRHDDGVTPPFDGITPPFDGVKPQNSVLRYDTIQYDTIRYENTLAPNDKNRSPLKNDLSFSFEKREFEGIIDRDRQQWSETFPAVDIDLAIKAAGQWLISNPSKKKKNYRRFLNNWFSRSQERGGNKSAMIQNENSDVKSFLSKFSGGNKK